MKKRLLSLVILCSLNNGCHNESDIQDGLIKLQTELTGIKTSLGDIQATTNINDAEISGVKAEVTAKVETEIAAVKHQSDIKAKEIGKLVENHGLPWQVTVAAYTLAAIVVCFIIWTQLKQLGHLGCIRKEK